MNDLLGWGGKERKIRLKTVDDGKLKSICRAKMVFP